MNRSRAGRVCRMVGAAVLFATVGLTWGCSKSVKVAPAGKTVEAGGVEFKVGSHEIRRLEVVAEDRTYEYDKPVLAIPLELTNTGKDPVQYTPTHRGRQMTEETTPLLYPDPGEKESLPPKDKKLVEGVKLEEGLLDEQVAEQQAIGPDETIRDIYLFRVPEQKQKKLIFSVPPQMHRGSLPVLFRIDYQYEEPEADEPNGLDDPATADGVSLRVTSAETEYLEIDKGGDSENEEDEDDEEKTYATSPLLKVSYVIKNDSDADITYEPKHGAETNRRMPSLSAGDKKFSRVRFKEGATAVGQVDGSKTIKSGEKVEDFTVFERPGEGAKVLTFEYPAARFGRGGILDFTLPYEYEEPEKPEALKEDG